MNVFALFYFYFSIDFDYSTVNDRGSLSFKSLVVSHGLPCHIYFIFII